MKQRDIRSQRLLLTAKVLLSFALICVLGASSLVARAEEGSDAQAFDVATAAIAPERSVTTGNDAQKQVVRVAYFDMGGYFTQDSQGQIDSYDRAYLDEISHYTDYRFEYVDCGTWSNALAMLQNHEVDLVGTMQYSPERAATYEMCSEKYGTTYAAIASLESSDLVYEDYDALGQATIGLTTGYIREAEMNALFAEHGISPSLVYYPDPTTLAAALADGEIDAVAVNSHTFEPDWKVLERYSYQPFFFASWKGNTQLIGDMNEAILAIDLYESDFVAETLQAYFPTIANAPFSKAELEYIDGADPITFFFEPDTPPLSSFNEKTGQMEGILVDLAYKMGEQTGLKVIIKPMPDGEFELGPNEYEFALVSENDKANPLMPKAVTTDSLLDGNFFLYARLGSTYDANGDTDYTVAVPNNRGGFYDYFSRYYPNYTVEQYEGPAECIEAVRNGEVDLAFLNSYCADSVLISEGIGDVVSIPTSGRTFSVCLAITGDDAEMLTSIINKGIARIDDQTRQSIIITYSLGVTPDATFAYFVKHNALSFAFLGVAAAALLALLLIWVMRFRIMRKQKIELDRTNAALESANAAKTEFLSRMSHDMRTPMNAIIGLTNIAQSEADDPDAMREYLDQIDSSSKFLLGLINDILDMARIEDGAVVLHPEPHNIDLFLEQINTLIKPLCDEKHIELNIVTESVTERVVLHDILRFNQIFFNLLSNAVKYTPDGGKVELIINQTLLEGDKVHTRFIVRDNGIGMSEEFQEHMFEPFTQENGKRVGVSGSTGLGLAITKNLVDLMGGTIAVKSSTGRGTEYCLEFDTRVVQEEAGDDTPSASNTVVSLKGRSILLCEDHPLNSQIVVRLLEKEGIEVICAANGQEGVGLFESLPAQTLDAILMDVRMPVMNGIEATKAIRALDRLDAKTVPIIALTANAYMDDVRQTEEAGMNAHIAKPFQPAELMSTLKYWIGVNESKSGQ